MVKMKHRKTMMMLGLVLATILMASSLFVNAATIQIMGDKASPQAAATVKPTNPTSSMIKPNPRPHVILPKAVDEIEDLDEKKIEELESIYSSLDDEDRLKTRSIWILWARGYSWSVDKAADAVEQRINCGMRIAARPVLDTGDGLLFEVLRGIVGNDGERYNVRGFGWLRKEDAVFYMKLGGEGFTLKAIGKVYRRPDVTSARRPHRVHRVAMKGNMQTGEGKYDFFMRGWAFRIFPRQLKPKPMPEKSETATTSS